MSEIITSPKIDQLSANLHPNLFSSRAWIQSLQQQYDFNFFFVADRGTSNFLPAAKITHFGFTKINVLPFCDYIIPSVESAEVLQKLIHQLKSRFPDIPIELKLNLPKELEPNDLPYSFKHTAYRHTVTTKDSIADMENNMDNSFLRGVRKAKSHELRITRTEDIQALDRFYEIYCNQRISKFGKLPQPYSFFQEIHKNFIQKGNGFIMEARKNSTVVAFMFILLHHKTLYYKFGCSVKDYLDLRPNNLLFYELFKYASANDYSKVGLGLSGVSKNYKGLVRFKEYMGGLPSNIYSLRFEPDDYNNEVENKLNTFTSSITNTIVSQNPDTETADAYSETLYPYFT